MVLVLKALCFGDFHLGQQMKVTRPPGRDPARIRAEVAKRTTNRNGPNAGCQPNCTQAAAAKKKGAEGALSSSRDRAHCVENL
jgi:hypothetical protein